MSAKIGPAAALIASTASPKPSPVTSISIAMSRLFSAATSWTRKLASTTLPPRLSSTAPVTTSVAGEISTTLPVTIARMTSGSPTTRTAYSLDGPIVGTLGKL